jgi:hypothetical protein
MDCRKAQEVLAAYHDGELPEADRAQVAAHVGDCVECAALLETMGRVDAAVEVPDPGPEYWERFHRRLEERIAQQDGAPSKAIVPRPRRGWVRQQLRYLVPAAVAAVLAVVIFRNIGTGPTAPARTGSPVSTQAKRVPAPEGPLARSAARDGRTAPSAPEHPRPAEGNAVADRASRTRVIREAAPPGPIAEQPTVPAPAPPRDMSSGGEGAYPTTAERGAEPTRRSEEVPVRSGQRTVAGAPVAAERSRSDGAARAKNGSGEMPTGECGPARELAAQGRLKEAESAQRACLARDGSGAAQERGMVFLAELLDRQGRFEQADAVIATVRERFPGSRPLAAYERGRSKVQGAPGPDR